MKTNKLLRTTRSVCPICLRQVKAVLQRREDGVYMEKSCDTHGFFSIPVWRDKGDLEQWRGSVPELADDEGLLCPKGCGACGTHAQGACCVLLEVTETCNLQCKVCFAEAGEICAGNQPDVAELKAAIDSIMGVEDKPLLQFSGGEPTLRDDLPELIAYARSRGCRYAQLNSNGIRLAEDEAYVKALADAGLSFVFLQFDGVGNSVYEELRGAPLFETKLQAIEMCDRYHIGVALVPTIVPGVNDQQIGDIIRLGAALSPAVRGVHFQPVSYMGRYPAPKDDVNRMTLDELMDLICRQGGIAPAELQPSSCDHPLCGFHGSFLVDGEALTPLSRADQTVGAGAATAKQNREFIGRRWERRDEPEADADANCCCMTEEPEADADANCCCMTDEAEPEAACDCEEEDCCDGDMETFDGFLNGVRKRGFTLTAMAFQDAMNLDIERLRRCSLHVYHEGILKPFCARYLTPIENDGLR